MKNQIYFTCPTCVGGKVVGMFMCGRRGCTVGMDNCSRCSGTGRITKAEHERIEAGRKRRDERIARDMSLIEEAKRRGISAVLLSRIERGFEDDVPPDVSA